MLSREAVYDEHINPLMAQIIALCKEHDIPVFASFQLEDKRDGSNDGCLFCTTCILPEDAAAALRDASAAFLRAARHTTMVVTVIGADGEPKVIEHIVG